MASHVTRESLLRAATEVFSEEGFSGARVGKIAHRAKANKALIYYHFGSKSKLYKAVLQRLFEMVGDGIQLASEQRIGPQQRLEGLYSSLLAAFERQPGLPRVMLREILAGGAHMDPSTARIMFEYLSQVRSALDQGLAQGVFRRVNPLLVHINAVGMLLIFCVSEAFRSRMAGWLGPEIEFPQISDAVSYLNDVLKRTLAPTPAANEQEGIPR